MSKFPQVVASFLKDESGSTAVEYAVMLALIIVVRIAAVTTHQRKQRLLLRRLQGWRRRQLRGASRQIDDLCLHPAGVLRAPARWTGKR